MADFGWVPIHCAASQGRLAAQLFLKLGISVDIMTTERESALHLINYILLLTKDLFPLS
jgi:ankyrin repeat protein